MKGQRYLRYTLSSGVGMVLVFEQTGEFADTVYLRSRRLTGADVEELFQHLNDAEMYGVDLDAEGEELDGIERDEIDGADDGYEAWA